MKAFVSAMAAAFVLYAGLINHVLADDHKNTIQVHVSAQVEAEPDYIRTQLYITEQNVSAAKAKQMVDAKTKQLLNRLSNLGISEQDVRSFVVRINPYFKRGEYGNRKQDGFEVSREISVVVRQWDQIDRVLDDAVGLGVNRIGNINAEVQDQEGLYLAALQLAVAKAMDKAELIAKQTNRKLGDVLSIQENGRGAPVMMEAMAKAYDSGVSQPGQQAISADLTVVFELN